jgi:hypothetical protein
MGMVAIERVWVLDYFMGGPGGGMPTGVRVTPGR